MEQRSIYEVSKKFIQYQGVIYIQMEKLISESMTPMSVSDIVKQMIINHDKEEIIRNSWWGSSWSFGTFDAYVRHPDKKIKIVRDAFFFKDFSEPWKFSSPRYPPNHGGKILKTGIYETLNAPEFKWSDIEKMQNTLGMINDPIWNALIPDKKIMNTFTNIVLNGQTRLGYKSDFDKNNITAHIFNINNHWIDLEEDLNRGGRFVGYKK